MTATCTICPHRCVLDEGYYGRCHVRINRNGVVESDRYGAYAALALDPIEKKPFARFHPGSKILSIGGYGCNLACCFCQNHTISQRSVPIGAPTITPQALTNQALDLIPQGNIGIAFTYNEPFVSFEFVLDTARQAHTAGLKVALITNGYVNSEPLEAILPYVSAMNIDLKAFNDDFYQEFDGDIETVKRTIARCMKTCHVELTTLIIPGENDSLEEMDHLAQFIAELQDKTPLHISKFFPQYRLLNRPPTPVETIYELADIARQHLKYVYVGNI